MNEEYTQSITDKCFVAGLRVNLASQLQPTDGLFKRWLTMPLLNGMYLTDFANGFIMVTFETDDGGYENLYDSSAGPESLDRDLVFILSSTLAHYTRASDIHGDKIGMLLKYLFQIARRNPIWRIGLQ